MYNSDTSGGPWNDFSECRDNVVASPDLTPTYSAFRKSGIPTFFKLEKKIHPYIADNEGLKENYRERNKMKSVALIYYVKANC